MQRHDGARIRNAKVQVGDKAPDFRLADHKGVSMSAPQKRTAAAASVLLLLMGSWVLARCGNSGPTDIVNGLGLLYFYADR